MCVVLSAGKDSSEGEQLIIQTPININADAGSTCAVCCALVGESVRIL